MKELLPDFLLALGGLLVPLGVGMIFVPAAIILAGVECLAVGVLLIVPAVGGRGR